jgi:subtilisin family serine protease
LEDIGVKVMDYVPYHAFLARMTPAIMEETERLPFIGWVGFYEPMYRVQPDLWSADDEISVEIIVFGDESVSNVVSALGDMVTDSYNNGEFNIIEALIPPSLLPTLAKLNEVYYIEPKSVMVPLNRNAQVVFQTNRSRNDPLARRIWDMGIDGTGQIITVADTGLDYDHVMVRESNEFTTIGDIFNVTDPNRRKLIRYMVMNTFNPEDSGHVAVDGNLTTGHGTSVAVAAAGNDAGLGNSLRDGMAKGAKLIVQDIGTVCRNPMHMFWWDDCLTYIPSNYTNLFLPAYENGSRIHSNSWGSVNSNYDLRARMVDFFMWDYKDMVILFANGNGGGCWGVYHNTGSPATAKSAISVGMTEGWRNQHNVSCGSSTGPTLDGRMKPDTLAFGSGRSARSSGDPFDEWNTSEEGWFGGSSYATPLTAGMAAMLRQYFLEGWYPGGVPDSKDSLNPSGALVKAMLVTSTQEMTGNNSQTVAG